jgi:4-hydroxybenzoate polyprenyltransferase
VSAVALVAGSDPGSALRLGVSMTALQASIGALNDVHDARADAGHKPGKPIPSGDVSVAAARRVVVVGAGLGLLLAATVDLRVAALAVVVLGIGYVYDLVAKGTAWSWLPFAVGIPILPVYGWLGGAGELPEFFAALVPVAVVAGAALAVANARVDLERDAASGTTSIATRLGLDRSWWLHAALWVVVVAGALGWLAIEGRPDYDSIPVVLAAGVLTGGVAISRRGSPMTRERAWRIQAVGAGAALLAWVRAALG